MTTTLFKRAFLYLAVALTVKLAIARFVLFGEWDPVGLLAGELAFALMVAAFVDLRRQMTLRTVLTADAIWTTALVAVIIFNSQFGRVPSVQALGWAAQLGGVKNSVTALLRPSYLLFYADLPLFWAVARIRPDFLGPALTSMQRRVLLWIVILVTLGNVGVAVFAPEPDFNQTVQARGIFNSELAEVVGTVFQTRIAIDAGDPARIQSEVRRIAGYDADGTHSGLTDGELASTAGAAAGRNVIVVLVESLQGLAVDRIVDGVTVTPTIDSLASEGWYFPNGYSQVAAGNTSDAELMFASSLYPLESTPLTEEYGDRAIPSLPRLLREAGYATATFHPNDVTFWNRDQLYQALGYTDIYDRTFFGEDDVVGIGPSDDRLFVESLAVLEEAHSNDEPFYASFVTLTGHHPFRLPADKRHLKLPDRMSGTLVGDYLASMHYTDEALGRFVDGLKTSGIWEDSIIVIVGDHFGLQQSQMTP